jgi:hypothetical protein
MLERFRRVKSIDTVFRTIEAYTSLGEQYPWAKWLINGVVAIMLSGWTIATGSLIPLAALIGLGTFVALSLLPAAVRVSAVPRSTAARQEAVASASQDADTLSNTTVSDISALVAALENQISDNTDAIQQEMNVLGEKLFSLRMLYEIHRLEPEIDRLIKSLNRPLAESNNSQDWALWKNDYIEIRSCLKKFVSLTQFYNQDIENQMFQIPPDVFKVITGHSLQKYFRMLIYCTILKHSGILRQNIEKSAAL